jgi:hypothetical protein
MKTTNEQAIGQEILISDQYFSVIGISENPG